MCGYGSRLVRVMVCTILVVGSAGCGVVDRVISSSFPSESPTFLDDETLCAVVPTQLARDRLSFRAINYAYWHRSYPESPDQNGFQCRILGKDSLARVPSTALYISYEPGGRLSTDGRPPFTDLDNEGYDPLVLEGVEGRGYLFVTPYRKGVHVAWLYPDNHVLDFLFFIEGTTDHTYGPDVMEGMRALAAVVVPAVPLIAAEPDQGYIRVPANT